MEGIGPNSNTKGVIEKKGRPQEQLNCPRCSSTNTKFCYYNNYSLTQPRYLCKTCRRYWTEGGSLRNVPVGGGSRKNKKLTSSSNKVPDLDPPSLISAISSQNPKMHDLNLAFPANSVDKYHGMSPYVDMPKLEIATHPTTTTTTNSSSSAVELLRSSMASRGLNPYVASNSLMSLSSSDEALFSPPFPMQEIKPSLGFSVDGLGNRSYENIGGGGRQILFPFGGQMKQIPSSVEVEHIKEQGNSTGYWTGMIGEGSSW